MLWIIKMLWYRYALRRYRPIDERTANVRFLVELGAHTHRDIVGDIARQIRDIAPFGVALSSRIVIQGQCEWVAEKVHTLCKELDRVRRSARHAAPEYLSPYSRIVDAHHKVHGTLLAIGRRLADEALTNDEFDRTSSELLLCSMDLQALYAESCKLYHSLTGAILADDVLRAGLADPYLHKRPGLAMIQIRSMAVNHRDFDVSIRLSSLMDIVVVLSFGCLIAGLLVWLHIHSTMLLLCGIPSVIYMAIGWTRRIRTWFSTMYWVERTFERP